MEKPSLARSPNIKEKKQYRESRFLKKSHYIPLRKRVKHEHIWSWQKRAPGSSSSISSTTKGKEMRKQRK
jgi:hypothetical protein